MAFFDKLGETLSSKGRDVAKKAKELAEVTSLNGQINAKEELMRHTYEEIGKAYYEANKNDESCMHAKQCEQVTALRHEISKLHRQIQVVKGIQVCTACGCEIPAGSAFCPGCGAPTASVNSEETDEKSEEKVEEESDSEITPDTDEEQNVSEEQNPAAASVSEEDVQEESESAESEGNPSMDSEENGSKESEEDPSADLEKENTQE